MRKIKTIKLGQPMTEPCKNCGLLYGYNVTDSCRRNFTMIFLSEDDESRSVWSDYVRTTSKGKRAYCANCGHDLKLNVDRSED